MTEDQIKHMVDRFLMWRLPKDFNPDCGISFDSGESYGVRREPVGTNLFSATEAEAMVRHMVEGLPAEPAVEIVVTPDVYVEVRKALIALGTGGVILERPLPRRIEMTGVTIVEGEASSEAPPHDDWPPRQSAVGMRDGHRRFGSIGQLFEVRGGQWVRIKRTHEK